jgi:hypothetical protein
VVFAAGVGIEFAQAFTGRKASLHDIIANGLGAAAAIAWALGASRQASLRGWSCRIVAAGLLCAAAARPVMTIARAVGEPPETQSSHDDV